MCLVQAIRYSLARNNVVGTRGELTERFVSRVCELRRLVKYIRPSLESPKDVVLVYGP